MTVLHVSTPAPSISITGGRGRLATLLARHFSARGHPITLFSRQGDSVFRSIETLREPETLITSNIIFHLAWSSLPSTAEAQSTAEAGQDLLFLQRLIESIAKVPANHRPLLVFFSSGGTVYGNAPGRGSREEDPCAPIGAYGRAKVAAEALITRHADQGLPFTILRVSNPYGHSLPASRPQGIISHALRCAQIGETLTLWGDGSARKDYLYHSDFTDALEHVVIQRPIGTFNLSAGTSHTVNEILTSIESHTGATLNIRRVPAPAWDVHDSMIDSAKFIRLTGWRPKIDLQTGIELMVKNARSPS